MTDGYQDPSAIELLTAVREFLSGPVLEATTGAVSFHARVAANALAIVERELAAGSSPAVERTAALADLGYDSEASLAAAIRDGSLDDQISGVAATLLPSAQTKVDIANPRWRT